MQCTITLKTGTVDSTDLVWMMRLMVPAGNEILLSLRDEWMVVGVVCDQGHPQEAPDASQATVEVEHPLPAKGASNDARRGNGYDGAQCSTWIKKKIFLSNAN